MKEKIKQVNELCAANGAYINQHGKKTVSAWSKIKYFREVFGTEFGINCVIQEHSDRYVIMKCIITKCDPEHIIATGYSKQFRDKPGYIEIAETFAITRALSFMGILLEDITSKEEYEELDIPVRLQESLAPAVQPMNTKGTSSAATRYDEGTINELIKKVHYAPHTAKLDFLWRANRELLDQIKIKDLATYNSILNKFNSKRDEITTQNEV
jgi:hypothetical protein